MKKILKYKKIIITALIIVLSVVSMFFQSKYKKVEKVNNTLDEELVVQVEGEIVNPGIYKFSKKARIIDLIDAAGGFTEKADLEKVNLAKRIIDGEKVNIVKKVEKAEETKENQELSSENSDMINLSTADKKELMKLDGIGESTAQKIIDYRDENGFDTIDDVKKVDGIGKSKFDKIKEKIYI